MTDKPFLLTDRQLEAHEDYAEHTTPHTPMADRVLELVCAYRAMTIERDEWRRLCGEMADQVERFRARREAEALRARRDSAGSNKEARTGTPCTD